MVNRIWPNAVAGKVDSVSSLSASACHIGGPNSVKPGQILLVYGTSLLAPGTTHLQWSLLAWKIDTAFLWGCKVGDISSMDLPHQCTEHFWRWDHQLVPRNLRFSRIEKFSLFIFSKWIWSKLTVSEVPSLSCCKCLSPYTMSNKYQQG